MIDTTESFSIECIEFKNRQRARRQSRVKASRENKSQGWEKSTIGGKLQTKEMKEIKESHFRKRITQVNNNERRNRKGNLYESRSDGEIELKRRQNMNWWLFYVDKLVWMWKFSTKSLLQNTDQMMSNDLHL
jgi:hypothetical protein